MNFASLPDDIVITIAQFLPIGAAYRLRQLNLNFAKLLHAGNIRASPQDADAGEQLAIMKGKVQLQNAFTCPLLVFDKSRSLRDHRDCMTEAVQLGTTLVHTIIRTPTIFQPSNYGRQTPQTVQRAQMIASEVCDTVKGIARVFQHGTHVYACGYRFSPVNERTQISMCGMDDIAESNAVLLTPDVIAQQLRVCSGCSYCYLLVHDMQGAYSLFDINHRKWLFKNVRFNMVMNVFEKYVAGSLGGAVPPGFPYVPIETLQPDLHLNLAFALHSHQIVDDYLYVTSGNETLFVYDLTSGKLVTQLPILIASEELSRFDRPGPRWSQTLAAKQAKKSFLAVTTDFIISASSHLEMRVYRRGGNYDLLYSTRDLECPFAPHTGMNPPPYETVGPMPPRRTTYAPHPMPQQLQPPQDATLAAPLQPPDRKGVALSGITASDDVLVMRTDQQAWAVSLRQSVARAPCVWMTAKGMQPSSQPIGLHDLVSVFRAEMPAEACGPRAIQPTCRRIAFGADWRILCAADAFKYVSPSQQTVWPAFSKYILQSCAERYYRSEFELARPFVQCDPYYVEMPSYDDDEELSFDGLPGARRHVVYPALQRHDDYPKCFDLALGEWSGNALLIKQVWRRGRWETVPLTAGEAQQLLSPA